MDVIGYNISNYSQKEKYHVCLFVDFRIFKDIYNSVFIYELKTKLEVSERTRLSNKREKGGDKKVLGLCSMFIIKCMKMSSRSIMYNQYLPGKLKYF